jgi:photosystem II stability/assembly factor-like uncharacterized protein
MIVVPLLLSILLAILGPAGTSAHDPSAYGGLFRSRDDGASWFPADPGLFLSGALGVAISPVDANHLLLATDSGLLRSRNGGRNWTREAPTVLLGSIYAVAFGADGQGALASTATRIYRTDDGSLWRETSAPSGTAPAYAIVPGLVPGRMYVAGPGGLWRSDDRGRSWLGAGEGLPEGAVSALVVTDPEETVYAIAAGGIWMSANDARSWHARHAGLPEGRVEALSSDPMGPDWLWVAAADQVFASADRGLSWHAVGQPLPEANTSVRGIAVAEGGTVIVLTTHRGLFRSVDGGRSWGLVEGNLPVHLEAGPLVRHPANPSTLYAGFALMPYSELWGMAIEGGSLLRRVDPLSLAGGAAFLVLLAIGAIIAVRWLARARNANATAPVPSQITETLR